MERYLWTAIAGVGVYILAKAIWTRTEDSAPATSSIPLPGSSGYPPRGATGDPLIVFFGNESTEIPAGFESGIESIAEAIQWELPETVIASVHGFTSSTGTSAFNQSLSVARAEAVANLLYDLGVDRNRIESVGHGESYPRASNGTDLGRQQNRRVEIWLITR